MSNTDNTPFTIQQSVTFKSSVIRGSLMHLSVLFLLIVLYKALYTLDKIEQEYATRFIKRVDAYHDVLDQVKRHMHNKKFADKIMQELPDRHRIVKNFHIKYAERMINNVINRYAILSTSSRIIINDIIDNNYSLKQTQCYIMIDGSTLDERNLYRFINYLQAVLPGNVLVYDITVIDNDLRSNLNVGVNFRLKLWWHFLSE